MPCKKHSGLANDRRAYYYSNCVKPTPIPPTPTPIPTPIPTPTPTPPSPCSLLPQETPYQLCSPWPQIGGLDNLNSRYTPILGSQSGNVNLLQTLDIPDISFVSSPTIASDGTIYICFNIGQENIQGFIISFNGNGTIKWSYTLIPGDSFTLITTSPVPPTLGKDGILYIGSKLGYVYAINPNNTTKWINQYTQTGNIGNISAGLIIGTDDNIYFGLNGENGITSLLSIQSSDGVENWSYILNESSLNIPIIPDSVAIDKYNNIYFAYQTTSGTGQLNYVVCLDNFGNELWICNINNGNTNTMRLSSGPTLSVDNSHIYILNNYQTGVLVYYLNAINTNDGSIDNSQSISILSSSGGFGGALTNSLARDLNDNLYFSINAPINNDITIYSVNKGNINWTYKIPTPENNSNAILTTPSVCLDGTIYFGLFFFSVTDVAIFINNYMYAINPNKTTKWVKLLTNTSTTDQPVIFSGFSINLQGNIIIPCLKISNGTETLSGISLYLVN